MLYEENKFLVFGSYICIVYFCTSGHYGCWEDKSCTKFSLCTLCSTILCAFFKNVVTRGKCIFMIIWYFVHTFVLFIFYLLDCLVDKRGTKFSFCTPCSTILCEILFKPYIFMNIWVFCSYIWILCNFVLKGLPL